MSLLHAKKEKRAALVAAGQFLPSHHAFVSLLDSCDMVLGVDGGYDALQSLGKEPDWLLGDFDSSRVLSRENQLQNYVVKDRVIRYPTQKDATDLELGLEFLESQGFQEVYLFGMMGSRLDHTLCNVSLLETFSRKGMQLTAFGRNNLLCYLLPGTYQLPEMPKEWYTSFLLFHGEVYLTLNGFEYPLEHALIPPLSSYCISNHIVSEENTVLVESSKGDGIFCMYARDGEEILSL